VKVSLLVDFMALVRLVALFTLMFSLLIGVCLQLGTSLPPNLSVMGRNPCPLPCVFEIVPGTTNLRQALMVMQQVAPDDHRLGNGHTLLFRMRDGYNRIVHGELMFLPKGLVVGAARISTAGSRAYLWRLGDMLAAGLQPSRVYRACTTPHLLMEFGENVEVVVQLRTDDSLRPETPLTLIHVAVADANTLYHARTDFGCRVEIGWRGFARRWAYLQAQGTHA
jgi:hypothetical protein